MAADLEYVTQTYLGSGTSGYMQFTLNDGSDALSAYKDVVVVARLWVTGNDIDGTSLSLQLYHNSGGWNQNYNCSSRFYGNHYQPTAGSHINNNPGIQIVEKMHSVQDPWGNANSGGMGVVVMEMADVNAENGRCVHLTWMAGNPPNYKNSSYYREVTLGTGGPGASWGYRNSKLDYARFYTGSGSFRSPSHVTVYGRKYS
tara:strand:- start:1388 stop:1990 length:603 start_codon:yes stop_codon:yes gene_type:complete